MNVNPVTVIGNTEALNGSAAGQAASDVTFSNYMEQGLSYADYLERIFKKAADTYQVSVDLLKAMAKAESNFRQNATSGAGAMGIMQLMPQTAASLGVSDAYDPEQNIMGGAKLISQLLQKYNGNLSYAIAAYNAGSGNVDKYGGIPPFKETQSYVAKVLGYLSEGVTIPGSTSAGTSSGTANTAYNNASYPAATNTFASTAFRNASSVANTLTNTPNAAGSSNTMGGALQTLMDQYFDYDDYLEFLQLFTKIVYEKVTGEELEDEMLSNVLSGKEDSGEASDASDAQGETQQVQRLEMRVEDSYGNISTYKQGEAAASEAYTAYQNMTAGNKNRLAVYLNRSSV